MQIPSVSLDGVPDPLPEALHVLDVREEFEWVHGHIEGSQHIPMSELGGRLDEVPFAQTLVVCKVGSRSLRVAAWLNQNGREAVNLDGGLIDWLVAGRPLVSETGQPPQIV